MGLLTKVENILSKPMEKIFKQKGFHPIDLSRLALRCLEKGCRKGMRRTYAPNTFLIYLHTSDYKDLYPFLKGIAEDITSELQRMVDERKYILAGDIEVRLLERATVKEGLPEIRGVVCCESEPDSVVSSTSLDDNLDLEIEINSSEQYKSGSDDKSGDSATENNAAYTTIMEEGKTIVREDGWDEEMFLSANDQEPTPGSGSVVEATSHATNSLPLLVEKEKHSSKVVVLQTNIPGVSLHIDVDYIMLENCLEYDKITVDGTVRPLTKLGAGSVVRIGELELKVSLP